MRRDTEAFTAWAVAATPRLLRSALALTGDHGHGQDLVQDVLAKVYVAWTRVEDPDAYAHRALVNAAASRWRSRGRRAERVVEDPPEVAVSSADEVVDDRLWVVGALRELTAGQRAVVVLRYLEDRSEAETAELLGVSRGTVKSQSSRALAVLRRRGLVVEDRVPVFAEED